MIGAIGGTRFVIQDLNMGLIKEGGSHLFDISTPGAKLRMV